MTTRLPASLVVGSTALPLERLASRKRRWKLPCCVLAAALLSSCATEEPPAAGETTFAAEADYVGGEQCSACHMAETELWRGSHHDLAMAAASPASVSGDFDDAQLTYNGITSEFFVRDGVYRVRTDGPGRCAHRVRDHTRVRGRAVAAVPRRVSRRPLPDPQHCLGFAFGR